MDGEVASQYLTFALDGEEYGIEILRVREIKVHSPITPVPGSPPEVLGVMNLRGTILPVIDLRRKLGMPAREPDRFTPIIVMTTGSRLTGLVVDRVSDVLTVPRDSVQPAPDLGGGAEARYVTGMFQTGDKLVLLLDIGAALSPVAPATADVAG